VARTIKSLVFQDKINCGETGVLLSTNSLFRNFEEVFLAENVPYKVSGRKSFFERTEIKDIIAYLRLMANPDDDVSLLRVINTPRRGIGRKTVEYLGETAKNKNCSLCSAMSLLVHAGDSALSEKMKIKPGASLELIETHRATAPPPPGPGASRRRCAAFSTR
jgi:DNA helicase-2/ATP-dependent DNA helicase PcrA